MRLAFHRQDDALVDVKGPPVIAREPSLIRWVCDKDRLKTRLRHGGTGSRDSAVIFSLAERGVSRGHGFSLGSLLYTILSPKRKYLQASFDMGAEVRQKSLTQLV